MIELARPQPTEVAPSLVAQPGDAASITRVGNSRHAQHAPPLRGPAGRCGMMPRTMTIWFVAAIPVLIMFFALAMERLEHRLRYLAARENLAVPEN